jgi:hypothetical protein
MYIAGTQYNFENRLHQLPTSIGDLNNFRAEYNSYGSAAAYLISKWDKEFIKKEYFLGKTTVGDNIGGVGGDTIGGVGGGTIEPVK